MTPSTPLGPYADNAIAWTTWVALMGALGTIALALVAGPVARRTDDGTLARTTVRLARLAAVFAILVVPAVLSDTARHAADGDGFDYSAAWHALYDGSNEGRLLGLEITLTLVAFVLILPLTVRSFAGERKWNWLLAGAAVSAAVALGTTKSQAEVPTDWPRTSFDTAMWMLHLGGGAIWIGGLIGLAAPRTARGGEPPGPQCVLAPSDSPLFDHRHELRRGNRTLRPVAVLGTRGRTVAAFHHHVRAHLVREADGLRITPAAAARHAATTTGKPRRSQPRKSVLQPGRSAPAKPC